MAGKSASDGSSSAVGVAAALGAVAIWVTWTSLTRLALDQGIDPLALTVSRFLVAGLVLLPLLIARRETVRRMPLWLIATISFCAGAPYVFMASVGFGDAPVWHGGLISAGVPLFVAVLAVPFLKERLSRLRVVGLAMILFGAIVFVVSGVLDGGSRPVWRGDLWFLLAAGMWALFTVAMRFARADTWVVTAVVGVTSMVFTTLAYVLARGFVLPAASPVLIGAHALFQGLVVSIAALYLFNLAVMRLGASRATAFVALVPGLSALVAIPVNGEWPGLEGWGRLAIISVGAFLATGAAEAVFGIERATPPPPAAGDPTGLRASP